MTTRRITVIQAGLSQPSSTRLLAERLSTATQDALLELGDESRVTFIDLREHAHDLANALLTGFATGALEEALEEITRADAVIAVTPVFQASYSGLFKTFIDVLPDDALRGTPVLMAATGGTARHSLVLEHAMRPMFAYLKAITVPTAVFAASQDWGVGGAVERGLDSRVAVAAFELASMVGGQAATRPRADQFADPVPFEELLGR